MLRIPATLMMMRATANQEQARYATNSDFDFVPPSATTTMIQMNFDK
jgi:hypothetical protein